MESNITIDIRRPLKLSVSPGSTWTTIVPSTLELPGSPNYERAKGNLQRLEILDNSILIETSEFAAIHRSLSDKSLLIELEYLTETYGISVPEIIKYLKFKTQ